MPAEAMDWYQAGLLAGQASGMLRAAVSVREMHTAMSSQIRGAPDSEMSPDVKERLLAWIGVMDALADTIAKNAGRENEAGERAFARAQEASRQARPFGRRVRDAARAATSAARRELGL